MKQIITFDSGAPGKSGPQNNDDKFNEKEFGLGANVHELYGTLDKDWGPGGGPCCHIGYPNPLCGKGGGSTIMEFEEDIIL
ncbi:hypothetical protein RBU61_16260 [Tissierella sp. MB52-C2]|uniref:hypothetical protein n=1 Tax=Tissierella sp. MB52-C2 TaxID=3070999 RepID=UPI00280B276C|nr:hypothetical protein [Tissierella sp. MB52-C2]WMM24466.1 hypothetical protein RBU61_16260 [Tissierella sp. MB52-C2]